MLNLPIALNDSRIKKLYLITFAISCCYLLLHFNSSIDGFAPLQVGAIDETVDRGVLLDAYRNTVPTFYVLGSELAMVLNENCRFLLYSPVQLIPYAVLFFVLMLKISNSYFLASLVSIAELMTGFTGTQRIFFWPHGVGNILYFALLILFLLTFYNKDKSGWQYHLMTVLVGISLVFTSYDVIFTYLLFLSSYIVYTMLFNNPAYLNRYKPDYRQSQSIKLFTLLIIIEMGLTEFVYDNFIYALKSPESFTMSVLDKFLLAYFSTNIKDNIIRDMYIQYPGSINFYGYIKYFILLAFLVLFFISFIYNTNVRYKRETAFVISILSSMLIWAAIRLLIGHVEIGFFYYPAIFSIAWLYRNGGSFKRWATIGVVILLILNPIYHILIYNSNLSNKDIDKFDYINMPLSWCKEETNGAQTKSDELTKNFYLLEYRSNNFQTFDENDVAFLLNRREHSPNDLFVINRDLNILNIGNWIQIKPWRISDDILNGNKKINKVLSTDKIFIYMKR